MKDQSPMSKARHGEPSDPSRPHTKPGWKFGAAVLAGMFGAVPTHAFAQSASPSQTPPGESAVEASPQAQFAFPPAQGLTPPPGSESIQVTLTDIVVEGQFGELTEASARLEASRLGRTVSVADVYGFALELQQAYFEAGYPLARVVVPPQELAADGRVRVVVVDGFIERTDVSQLPERVRGRIQRVLAPLVGQRGASRAKLERALLIAGDTAGVRLNSTLTPGSATGATVQVLSGEHDAVAGAVSVDNRVGEELGRWQATGSVVFNSPFGHGERIYALAAIPPKHNGFRADSERNYVGVGIVAPFGIDGGTWHVSLDYSSTHPQGSVAAQKLESEYARLAMGVDMPIVRSRTLNVSGGVEFDAISDVESTRFTGQRLTLSADRTRALRVSLQASNTLSGDVRIGALATLSRGLNVAGARGAGEATPLKPLSRAGADSDFTTLQTQVSLAAPAVLGTQVSFSARGQHSFNQPLVRSEQFSPSGWDGLSGPPPGGMTGDGGSVARIEWQRPVVLTYEDGAYVAPYVFATSSVVTLENPSALERRRSEAAGAGAGLRYGIGRSTHGGYDVTATFEVSHINSDRPNLDRDWLTASITARF
jgi:hemolysin activation/secretion protein